MVRPFLKKTTVESARLTTEWSESADGFRLALSLHFLSDCKQTTYPRKCKSATLYIGSRSALSLTKIVSYTKSYVIGGNRQMV
jgi:hypothetical protein